jgi:hypothetical protein
MTVTPAGTTKVPLAVYCATRENGGVTVMSPVPTSDAPPTVLSVTVPAVPLIESTPAVTFSALTHDVPLYVRSSPVPLLTYALPATSAAPPRPVVGSAAAAPSQRASSDARRRASAFAADAALSAAPLAEFADTARSFAAVAFCSVASATALICVTMGSSAPSSANDFVLNAAGVSVGCGAAGRLEIVGGLTMSVM